MAGNQCREDGCTQAPMKDVSDSRCLFHSSSDLAKRKRQEGRRAGGTARGRKYQAENLRETPSEPQDHRSLLAWNQWVLMGVSEGTISQSLATTIRQLIKDMHDQLEAAREEEKLLDHLQELSDVNKRLRSALEQERRKNSGLESKIRRLEGADTT